MDANQRSETNNQTDNVANTKWTPGAKGKTADSGQPLDHTYPNGSGVQQMGNQDLGDRGTQQTGAGAGGVDGFDRSDALNTTPVPGGSMETQINGGSGTVQGITDSHQRAMEQTSGAYGKLELPVGDQPNGGGVDVSPRHDAVNDRMSAQNPAQPDLRAGSPGTRQSTAPSGGMSGANSAQSPLPDRDGAAGNRQSANPGAPQHADQVMQGSRSGPQGHDGEEAQAGNTQLGVAGSAAGANQNSDAEGVHRSNDTTGGLPRSPGNAGPRHGGDSTDRAGSQTGAADGGPGHESNDAAGGYPRSQGYANRLAGDSDMDDDTGFKRK